MQTVIDIDDEVYARIMQGSNGYNDIVNHAIRYGSPLPKGQPCDNCEVGNPCLYCKYDFETKESEDKK